MDEVDYCPITSWNRGMTFSRSIDFQLASATIWYCILVYRRKMLCSFRFRRIFSCCVYTIASIKLQRQQQHTFKNKKKIKRKKQLEKRRAAVPKTFSWLLSFHQDIAPLQTTTIYWKSNALSSTVFGESVPIRRVNVCFATCFFSYSPFYSSSSFCSCFRLFSSLVLNPLVDFRKLQFNQFSVMATFLLLEL